MKFKWNPRPTEWRDVGVGFLSAIILGVAAAGTAATMAADGPPGGPMMHDGEHGPHGHGMERWLGELKTQLNLNAQQGQLWDQAMARMKPPADAPEKMHAMHENLLKALDDPKFDPRQMSAQMDQMRAEREAHMQQIRDAWFAVWDSLNPAQRGQVRAFLRGRASAMEHGHEGWHHPGDEGGHGEGGDGWHRHGPGPDGAPKAAPAPGAPQ